MIWCYVIHIHDIDDDTMLFQVIPILPAYYPKHAFDLDTMQLSMDADDDGRRHMLATNGYADMRLNGRSP